MRPTVAPWLCFALAFLALFVSPFPISWLRISNVDTLPGQTDTVTHWPASDPPTKKRTTAQGSEDSSSPRIRRLVPRIRDPTVYSNLDFSLHRARAPTPSPDTVSSAAPPRTIISPIAVISVGCLVGVGAYGVAFLRRRRRRRLELDGMEMLPQYATDVPVSESATGVELMLFSSSPSSSSSSEDDVAEALERGRAGQRIERARISGSLARRGAGALSHARGASLDSGLQRAKPVGVRKAVHWAKDVRVESETRPDTGLLVDLDGPDVRPPPSSLFSVPPPPSTFSRSPLQSKLPKSSSELSLASPSLRLPPRPEWAASPVSPAFPADTPIILAELTKPSPVHSPSSSLFDIEGGADIDAAWPHLEPSPFPTPSTIDDNLHLPPGIPLQIIAPPITASTELDLEHGPSSEVPQPSDSANSPASSEPFSWLESDIGDIHPAKLMELRPIGPVKADTEDVPVSDAVTRSASPMLSPSGSQSPDRNSRMISLPQDDEDDDVPLGLLAGSLTTLPSDNAVLSDLNIWDVTITQDDGSPPSAVPSSGHEEKHGDVVLSFFSSESSRSPYVSALSDLPVTQVVAPASHVYQFADVSEVTLESEGSPYTTNPFDDSFAWNPENERRDGTAEDESGDFASSPPGTPPPVLGPQYNDTILSFFSSESFTSPRTSVTADLPADQTEDAHGNAAVFSSGYQFDNIVTPPSGVQWAGRVDDVKRDEILAFFSSESSASPYVSISVDLAEPELSGEQVWDGISMPSPWRGLEGEGDSVGDIEFANPLRDFDEVKPAPLFDFEETPYVDERISQAIFLPMLTESPAHGINLLTEAADVHATRLNTFATDEAEEDVERPDASLMSIESADVRETQEEGGKFEFFDEEGKEEVTDPAHASDSDPELPTILNIPHITLSIPKQDQYPDPELFSFPPSRAVSPLTTKGSLQTPTPPPSPPLSPGALLPPSKPSSASPSPSPSPSPSRRLLPLQARDRETPSSSPTTPRPAWSIRASDAPALGLGAPKKEREPSPMMLSTSLPGSFDTDGFDNAAAHSDVPADTDAKISTPPGFDTPSPKPVSDLSLSGAVSGSTTVATLSRDAGPRMRNIRSPVDIALAMQLRPGLGVGADAAWMVRFLMAMFGWFTVLVGRGVEY